MITRDEADQLRDQLLQLLAEDTHNTERLLARLEAISRESGIGAHPALLLILTQLAFDDAEARRHWEGILAQRHALSLALGRDAGLRVAVLDYFMNVNKRLVNPTLIDVEMEEPATGGRDPLTGLAGDRAFRVALAGELRRARRYGHPVAIAIFDLDGFAALNDRVGELVSDRLLREAAMILGNKIRDIDVAARPGEDELAVLLPQTDRNGAFLVAERFRREIESHFRKREAAGRPAGLTVSGGVAAHPDDGADAESLIERAVQSLYQAKASGKNVVLVHSPERRRFLRFDLQSRRCEIEVLAPADAGEGRPRNLSRSGLLFASPEPLEVGEDVEIRLEGGAPDARRVLVLRGRVVRLEEVPSGESDRFEVGVAFDLDAGTGEDDLLEFLERTSPSREPGPE
ncbi:MAG TPA: diguanylate cyclase [Candidatus Polarisedimenticolaceae bacterium]|nr:diguanylate cyclase [Candidatus Polarisedimenticolaceae bacterium]